MCDVACAAAAGAVVGDGGFAGVTFADDVAVDVDVAVGADVAGAWKGSVFSGVCEMGSEEKVEDVPPRPVEWMPPCCAIVCCLSTRKSPLIDQFHFKRSCGSINKSESRN